MSPYEEITERRRELYNNGRIMLVPSRSGGRMAPRPGCENDKIAQQEAAEYNRLAPVRGSAPRRKPVKPAPVQATGWKISKQETSAQHAIVAAFGIVVIVLLIVGALFVAFK